MALVLTLTLETEIADKRAEIAEQEVQTSRTQRVLIVQPLKDELHSLIKQNESIISANAILTAEYVPILTLEELNKELSYKRASDIAIDYPLSEQMELNWKIQKGELTMESAEMVAFMVKVDEINAKYPKV